MISAVFYFVLGAFLLYVILPYFDKNFRKKYLELESPEEAELLLRKDEILGNLNDLEFDFRMKKISEPDYLQLKEKLTQDYINIKRKLDYITGKHHATGLENRNRTADRIGS